MVLWRIKVHPLARVRHKPNTCSKEDDALCPRTSCAWRELLLSLPCQLPTCQKWIQPQDPEASQPQKDACSSDSSKKCTCLNLASSFFTPLSPLPEGYLFFPLLQSEKYPKSVILNLVCEPNEINSNLNPRKVFLLPSVPMNSRGIYPGEASQVPHGTRQVSVPILLQPRVRMPPPHSLWQGLPPIDQELSR